MSCAYGRMDNCEVSQRKMMVGKKEICGIKGSNKWEELIG
jgi:hypothetical protein